MKSNRKKGNNNGKREMKVWHRCVVGKTSKGGEDEGGDEATEKPGKKKEKPRRVKF